VLATELNLIHIPMLVQPMLTRLQAQQDLRSVLNAALHDIVALHGAEFGNIRLADGQGGLVMVAQSRLSGDFAASLGRVDIASGTACARAAQEGRTVFVADIRDDPHFAPLVSSTREALFKSVLSSPFITSQGNCLGVASAHFANGYRPSRVELESLKSYCRQVAHVIEGLLAGDGAGATAELLHRELLSAAR
jgi:GAF domain-containing protein